MAPNSGTKLHGKNGAIYLTGPKGTGTKVSNKTAWTLSLARDRVDATVFGDTNKTSLVGLRDISGTFDGLLDVSGDLLLSATTLDEQAVYLYADDTATPVLVGSGMAFIDAVINASNADAVKISGNFFAQGPWGGGLL
jgi:hypothetical protein